MISNTNQLIVIDYYWFSLIDISRVLGELYHNPTERISLAWEESSLTWYKSWFAGIKIASFNRKHTYL